MTDSERALEALCLRGLLRHLGAGERSPYGGPISSLRDEDTEALRMWWALSGPVGSLASRVASRPREISPALDDFRREVSGELPGPPDAAASAILQAVTCDSAAFVVTEAAGSWFTGPNRILAKTLDSARGALRAAALHARGGIFDGLARERLSLVDDALRVTALREILASPAGRSRIGAHERRQAAKARAPLYRLSWDCASALAGLEALEPESVAALLAGDVLPRLDTWRQFEISCLLEVAEALSAAIGVRCVLDASFAAGRPAAKVGHLDLWWQRSIPTRPEVELDKGEKITAELADSLGIAAGSSRADLTIERSGRIVAIVECKWFGAELSAPRAILDACAQLTGYARDSAFRQGEDSAAILSRSLIALAHRGNAPLRVGSGPVGCLDLSDLGSTVLVPWASAVAAAA